MRLLVNTSEAHTTAGSNTVEVVELQGKLCFWVTVGTTEVVYSSTSYIATAKMELSWLTIK